MPIFWFLVSVAASLLTPVPAIGGIMMGGLWGTNRMAASFAVVGAATVVMSYLSFWNDPKAGYGDNIYSVSVQLCAMVIWAMFAGALTSLLKEAFATTRGFPPEDRLGQRSDT
jgi:hypothetical protein